MKKALLLAARGAGATSPNPMVGALLVKEGIIIAQGYHEAFGGPHAEANVIRKAGPAARDSVLYVTLEPCNHQGQTPPCTEAVLKAGISRVVFGMHDPNPHVAGGGGEHLRRRGLEVVGNLLERECRIMNQPFIKHVTTGLPYVTLKAAATLDGFIATSVGDSKWITNERSRKFAHRLRFYADGILVGIGTVLADDPLLTARTQRGRNSRQPVRIVLDTKLQLPVHSQLVQTAGRSPVWVICGKDAPGEKERLLTEAGVKVIRTAGGRSGVEIPELLKELGKRRIANLLIEGGGRVHGSFLESGLVDQFHFFYAPKILGDPTGVKMLSGGRRLKIAECVAAHGIRTRRFGDDLLVSGRFREELY